MLENAKDGSTLIAAIPIGVAVISAGAAIVISMLTYHWTKRREHETEWRHMKIEQYKEFVTALSGIVGSRSTREAQARYADAVNSLTLVASPDVMRAIYSFQDEIANLVRSGASRSDERHDKLLSDLLNAIRLDIQPNINADRQRLTFRLLDVPPQREQLNPQEPLS